MANRWCIIQRQLRRFQLTVISDVVGAAHSRHSHVPKVWSIWSSLVTAYSRSVGVRPGSLPPSANRRVERFHFARPQLAGFSV